MDKHISYYTNRIVSRLGVNSSDTLVEAALTAHKEACSSLAVDILGEYKILNYMVKDRHSNDAVVRRFVWADCLYEAHYAERLLFNDATQGERAKTIIKKIDDVLGLWVQHYPDTLVGL